MKNITLQYFLQCFRYGKKFFVRKMVKYFKKINENWLRKKVKYEKPHKYAGNPLFLLDRNFIPEFDKTSPNSFKTKN
jgi:hypothetical protein